MRIPFAPGPFPPRGVLDLPDSDFGRGKSMYALYEKVSNYLHLHLLVNLQKDTAGCGDIGNDLLACDLTGIR